MATKNISITEEAYRRLGALRRGNESFSEIIRRIRQPRDIMQFAGILSKKSTEDLKKNLRMFRIVTKKAWKERVAEMRRRLS